MTYIKVPEYLYNTRLLEEIRDHIVDKKDSYIKLSDAEKSKLVKICLDILGEDAWEVIIESEDRHMIMSHFKRFLATSKQEHAQDMAIAMEYIACSHFSKYFVRLFEEQNQISRDMFKLEQRYSAEKL